MLRKYPFFKLEVIVGSGRDLIAMDRGGKFVSNLLYKNVRSRILAKNWLTLYFLKD